MNIVSAIRGAYGTALLLAPARVLAVYGAAPTEEPPRTVARVLGARHIAQAIATNGGRFARLGALVDALHAASMFALIFLLPIHLVRIPTHNNTSAATEW